MSKGRKPARLTKVEKFDSMTKQLETMAMALRLNQMMVQNLNKQMNSMHQDLTTATGLVNDFQYRLLALQQLSGIDTSIMQTMADSLKILDFDKESAKKDLDEEMVEIQQIESDEDTVIISSSTPDVTPDQGILRSRIKIADMNQPQLATSLKDKKLGDEVEANLNNTKHIIRILGIRRTTKVSEPAQKAE